MSIVRPHTAGPKRSTFEQRPLGRSPLPAKLLTAVSAGSVRSQIVSLKGEILLLQHRFQETRLNGPLQGELEALERKLTSFVPSAQEECMENIDMKCSLLEMLIEQIKSLSLAALERCAEDVSNISPARSSTFLRLVEFVVGVADRKRAWDTKIHDHSHTHGRSQTPDGDGLSLRDDDEHTGGKIPGLVTTLDLAMNEPTAAEVRKLVAEQRVIQEQLKSLLRHQHGATPEPTSSVKMTGSARRGTMPQNVPLMSVSAINPTLSHGSQPQTPTGTTPNHQAQLHASLEASAREIAEYRKKVESLEETVKSLRDNKPVIEAEEIPADVQRLVRGLAYGSDFQTLTELGVVVPVRQIVTDSEASLFAQRLMSLMMETSNAYAAQFATRQGDGKGKKDSVLLPPPLPIEGMLWATLAQQFSVLEDAVRKFKQRVQQNNEQLNTKEAEITRLKRVTSTLEQRVQLLKVQGTKTSIAFEAEIARLQGEVERFKNLYDDQIASMSFKTKRIVNAKGQVATAEERERTLKEEVASRQQSIGDLTEQLQGIKRKLEEEQTASAAVARERISLLRARDLESQKVQQLLAEGKEREEALQASKESYLMLKKDLREKNVAETEMQQKAWKLEVELHIAQNVISELRQREVDLTKASRNAEACREDLQEEVYKLRDELALRDQVMQGKLGEAQQELVIAKAMLNDERTNLMTQEKEVERLRIVDIKMESLEQNFTNYAASKIAQREAGEEEERMLGECLESLDNDPFVIPGDREGEAQLQLYIRELSHTKQQYEADDRIRKRSRGPSAAQDEEKSSKKQLLLLLRARFTEIQLFACQQRLRQMQLERDNRNLHIQASELKSSQAVTLQELGQARLQCESLAHRNSELEIERKQFIKQRSTSEQEVKTLKANAQRLRVSHDEQEKLLVDLGTKLQAARMLDSSNGEHQAHNSLAHLPSVVMD